MNKPIVHVSGRVAQSAIDKLKEADLEVRYRDEVTAATAAELAKNAKDADALVCYLEDRIDDKFLSSCPKLKVVANVAVGYDNINIEDATKRGILVVNTPGVLTNATADLAFALLISAARRLVEADRFVRAGKWVGWSTDLLLGTELGGKTLGIIGMGRIGEALAQRAVAFGMNIIYTRKGNEEKDVRLAKELGATRVSLGELLKNSDFISVHSPLNSETRNLLGKTEFARMKPNCIFVNTARGAIVDQQALIEALKTGQIAAAGLDVFVDEPSVPKPLCEMDNVIVVPHIGSATVETRRAMAEMAVSGVVSAFKGVLPPNAVNPEAFASPSRHQ